jgi:hypothetical protein
MYKIHEIKSGSITINAGSSSGSVTISHSLGYVPKFLVYEDGQLFPSNVGCYATSSGIIITKYLSSNYGEDIYSVDNYWDSYFSRNTSFMVGDYDGSDSNGAMRFTGIGLTKSQSISSASIDVYVGVKGSGSGDLRQKVYGIDEDNTGEFSGDPLTRDKTSAVTEQTVSLPAATNYFGVNVKSQVEEIISRSGWSTGNALGFNFFDNGSPDDVFTYNSLTGYDDSAMSILRIIRNVSLTTNYKVVIFKDKITD